LYFTDPERFVIENISKMFVQDKPSGKVIGNTTIDQGSLDTFNQDIKNLQKSITDGTAIDTAVAQRVFKGIKSQLAEKASEKWQAPLSLYTGAPIGEWHVVIGNPYNPIAMIGNLICTDITVNFGDALGPDDFPTTLEASITLAHGRPRERGEIESIFNQGDGRLYQTVQSTSSNAQTYNTIVDINGNVLTNENLNNLWGSDDNGGVVGSNAPVTTGNIFDQDVNV